MIHVYNLFVTIYIFDVYDVINSFAKLYFMNYVPLLHLIQDQGPFMPKIQKTGKLDVSRIANAIGCDLRVARKS